MTETEPGGVEDSHVQSVNAEIPAELLRQLVAVGGGKVTLVIGAGASIEAPTRLETGAAYSERAHAELVADGVLSVGDCDDPSDLSVLAEVVFDKCGGSQGELTRRLPKTPWQLAPPNTGHLVAAALLSEGALHHVITLNYDRAMQNALVELRGSGAVSVVAGPEDHANLGTNSVIYLHRSVDQPEEDWVLRRSALDSEWKGAWEEAIARAGLVGPTTVFVGLGSPARVLTSSVERLAEAAQVDYYLVDPAPDSAFRDALGTNLTGEIPLYWCGFMGRLATRFLLQRISELREECNSLVACMPELGELDFEVGLELLQALGLIAYGRLRAGWLGRKEGYLCSHGKAYEPHIADLLLGLCWVARETSAQMRISEADASVVLEPPGRRLGRFAVFHGRGIESLDSIAAKVERLNQARPLEQRVRGVLVAGAKGDGRRAVGDLIRGDVEEDLIRGPGQVVVHDLDAMRVASSGTADDLSRRLSE